MNGKISVNLNQEHNPVLKLVRNVPWEYGEDGLALLVDYLLGRSTGILFLSVKYHRLHPNYIYERLRPIPRRKYRLQIILLLLDDPQNWARSDKIVREVSRAAILLDWTVVLAWTPEEAARWLEALHAFQSKSAAALRERAGPGGVNPEQVLVELPGINRTDARRLLKAGGGTLQGVALLTMEQVLQLPGFGIKKATTLMEALDAPFIVALEQGREE